MAYPNPYFPTNYSPYPVQYPQVMGQNMQMQQTQPQSSSFIHVQSETQAREWAVAPNTSITFIDDTKPYCYTKSMGASLLEPPVFKRFKLVEEDISDNTTNQSTTTTQQIDLSEYLTKAEFEEYRSVIEDMQKIVKELNGNE